MSDSQMKTTPGRVMLVDDSVIVRTIVARWVKADPELDVVGTASSGAQALANFDRLNPDVVVLDVEMPNMTGLELLTKLLTKRPDLDAVMFSTLTERGAATALKALSCGARDYLAKPTSMGGASDEIERIKQALLTKLRHFSRKAQNRRLGLGRPAPRPIRPLSSSPSRATSMASAVVIGASTGGPPAVSSLLDKLGDRVASIPTFIAVHMPPVFTRLFAEQLRRETGLEVIEADEGVEVQAGVVYLARGDTHLKVIRRGSKVVLHNSDVGPVKGCRPSVDVLFESAAKVYGAGLIAAVLTGMGTDGREGCAVVKRTGGQVLAQDEATSVAWGMPGSVVEAGLAHHVGPIDELSKKVLAQVGALRSRAVGNG